MCVYVCVCVCLCVCLRPLEALRNVSLVKHRYTHRFAVAGLAEECVLTLAEEAGFTFHGEHTH